MRFVSHHNFLIKNYRQGEKRFRHRRVTPFEGRKCQIIPIRSRLRVADRQLNEAICLYADVEIAVTISSWKPTYRITFTKRENAHVNISHKRNASVFPYNSFLCNANPYGAALYRSQPGKVWSRYTIAGPTVHFQHHLRGHPLSGPQAAFTLSRNPNRFNEGANDRFYVCPTIVSKITEARYKKRMIVKSSDCKSYRNY